ncbi:hypothetical protein [Barnesiella intestinihominis]|uniref:hypothetical protein n=1 Tax=Barnesiella intestinihominis TaxID=487174 RepID=UPI00266575E6|nr:hypothetical protein [Barnesiella intestinihominis]
MKIEDIENAALDCALFEDYYYNPDLQPAYIDGFKRGASWRIDSVWHEASEEPERNRIYLAQLGDSAFDTFYDSGNWEIFPRRVNMQRWAYVEDLLPNKQEE